VVFNSTDLTQTQAVADVHEKLIENISKAHDKTAVYGLAKPFKHIDDTLQLRSLRQHG